MPVALLDTVQCRAATGTDRYVCALLDRRGGFVNPLGYARGLAQAAQQAGATTYGGSPALKVSRNNGAWRVQTPKGALLAEKLVLGTNGYTDNLWPRLRRSIVPVYSAIVATEPLPEPLARDILPERSVLYEIGAVTTYYRLDAWGRLLMGGRSPMRDMADLPDFDYLTRYARKLWPALNGVRWTHGWNGQLAITTDHYPHFHEPADGVLAVLGYNGRGVAMATAMGTLIAKRVLGAAKNEIDMPITDLRAIPFHALWRNAARARIAYGRIKDYLGL
jgi:glycine/D-amino acid oxidase-like deaminating enzyme